MNIQKTFLNFRTNAIKSIGIGETAGQKMSRSTPSKITKTPRQQETV